MHGSSRPFNVQRKKQKQKVVPNSSPFQLSEFFAFHTWTNTQLLYPLACQNVFFHSRRIHLNWLLILFVLHATRLLNFNVEGEKKIVHSTYSENFDVFTPIFYRNFFFLLCALEMFPFNVMHRILNVGVSIEVATKSPLCSPNIAIKGEVNPCTNLSSYKSWLSQKLAAWSSVKGVL